METLNFTEYKNKIEKSNFEYIKLKYWSMAGANVQVGY